MFSKRIILFLLWLGWGTAYPQKNGTLCYYYDAAVQKIPLMGSGINTKYQKTDTVNGFELTYYYVEKNSKDKCNGYLFFTTDTSVLHAKDIISFFKSSGVYITDEYGSAIDASGYVKNRTICTKEVSNEYRENNFNKFLEKGNSQNEFYRISHQEYIKVARVKAVADFIVGDESLVKYFCPLECFDKKKGETLLQIHYRKVLAKEFIYPDVLFGAKKSNCKGVHGCFYAYD